MGNEIPRVGLFQIRQEGSGKPSFAAATGGGAFKAVLGSLQPPPEETAQPTSVAERKDDGIIELGLKDWAAKEKLRKIEEQVRRDLMRELSLSSEAVEGLAYRERMQFEAQVLDRVSKVAAQQLAAGALEELEARKKLLYKALSITGG